MAQPQKRFDPKKGYAVIYGHLSGKYEQDGVIFGGNGLPVGEKQLAEDDEKLARELHDSEQARRKELAAK